MWRGEERWPEAEENRDGKFRWGWIKLEVPMRWPSGAVQMYTSTRGSAAKERGLDTGARLIQVREPGTEEVKEVAPVPTAGTW